MKNNKKIIMTLLLLCISITGCTKYLKDDNNKIVVNELDGKKTGQNIVENILCRPKLEETLNIYKKHNVNIEKLSECQNFKISEGENSFWQTFFVKPLAWVIIKIGEILKNYGLAVILTTLLIRLALYPVTKKTALQSELLKKAKPELDKIEEKYKNRKTQEAQMQKSQETMIVYKKHKINPLSGCLFSFIQIPLFFAFFEALNRLPIIFEGSFLGINLGLSPINGFNLGYYYYIILNILVICTTYFSFKLNSTAAMSKDQEKQMKTMMKISVVMISVMSFTMSSAIILYWISNSSFTIIQNIIVKRRKKNDSII